MDLNTNQEAQHNNFGLKFILPLLKELQLYLQHVAGGRNVEGLTEHCHSHTC